MHAQGKGLHSIVCPAAQLSSCPSLQGTRERRGVGAGILPGGGSLRPGSCALPSTEEALAERRPVLSISGNEIKGNLCAGLEFQSVNLG